jgi:hypothetical protein
LNEIAESRAEHPIAGKEFDVKNKENCPYVFNLMEKAAVLVRLPIIRLMKFVRMKILKVRKILLRKSLMT